MEITRHPLCAADTDRELGDLPTDHALVERLATSFRGMLAKGSALADRFYARLFERHPGLRGMFPDDMTAQKAKLLTSLEWVVEHLRDPATVRPWLVELGRRHVGYGARREHYPMIVEALVAGMRDVSGEAWSAGLEADWTAALQLASERMCEAYAKQEVGRQNSEVRSQK